MHQSIELLHKKLKEGEINHLQFLNTSEHAQEYQAWCRSMNEAPTEENAEFFYDMHGFDADVKHIIVETV